jgi:lactoylglutathione lyase
MLKLRNIDHINMNVKDLKKTIGFYQALFGFKVFEEGQYDGEPYVIIGRESQAFLCLYEKVELEIKGNTIFHIGYHIENFDETGEVLSKLNIPIEMSFDYGPSKSHYIKDPSGYTLEITEKFGGDIHLQG